MARTSLELRIGKGNVGMATEVRAGLKVFCLTLKEAMNSNLRNRFYIFGRFKKRLDILYMTILKFYFAYGRPLFNSKCFSECPQSQK